MRISPINNYQYNKKQNSNTFVLAPYREGISYKQNNPNFKQIKPEYMFINTKGFTKNRDWARNVIKIIDSGKELIQKNKKFDDLIKFVTNKYNTYYKTLSLFERNYSFGAPRTNHSGNMLENKYEPYKKRAKDFIEKNTTKDYYAMPAYLPSQNKQVELTAVRFFPFENGDYMTGIEAPEIEVIKPVMDEVACIYENLKKEKDFDKITNSVAQIHWLISQARPYSRGSAGIADMLSKMIFEAKGIQVSAYKKDVNPNLEAFVMPIEEYCQKYPEFFSEPLRKMTE